MKLPWPIVTDAFLTALAIQAILAIAGHFIGILGRHHGVLAIVTAVIMGFVFGVWANPTPAMAAGLGGILVAGGSALIGAAIVYFMGDGTTVALARTVMISVAAGLIAGAIGSVVGRSVFGA
jgi:hypothetical protein